MTSNKWMVRSVVLLVIAIACTPAWAQRGGRSLASNLRNGRDVKTAFKSVVAKASQSTVRVMSGGRDIALGAVVGADGWIITKYSELREPLVCWFNDGRQLPAKVVGADPTFDLAMLKVNATGLKTVQWADGDVPAVGQFLATASIGELPQAIGVVSVPPRAIPHRAGVLGVVLDDAKSGAKILEVWSGSGADEAGLKVGDVVVRVNDKAIDSREVMIATVQKFKPLDNISLVVQRGEEQLNIKATLRARGETGQVSRSDRMNAMGGPLSKRSADFPTVIQHDTVLRPSECGGPVVDLSGKVVGINIARSGRTESFAVPADQVRAELADLESGRLAQRSRCPAPNQR